MLYGVGYQDCEGNLGGEASLLRLHNGLHYSMYYSRREGGSAANGELIIVHSFISPAGQNSVSTPGRTAAAQQSAGVCQDDLFLIVTKIVQIACSAVRSATH